MKDYKDTLLMGKTGFEMRGNLGKREPLFQEKWEKLDLYNKVLEKNVNKKEFTLHDGPPYANGEIHIGHAFNKILKDFVVRYKNMSGFKAAYIPGWDTHGLPIETALTKAGINRKEKTPQEFRTLCEKYAYEQVEIQKVGFKRLGVLADYDHSYLTLQHDFEADQVRVFARMAERGLIFKGLKPVYWSPSSESALAEAEIEYYDKIDSSIYFKLDILNGEGYLKDAAFIVWTTTPWTLPGNLAVCAGPEITYVVCNTSKGKFVFGRDLLEKLTTLLEFEHVQILSELKGTDLEKLQYKHPLYERISPCVLGDYVTTTDGSGLVHIAPGHGEDDFMVGKIYGLEVLCPVNGRGVMTNEAGKYEGLFYEACNAQVIEDMKECGALLKSLEINHSYPHDWRTKKPVIFRATPQWFASIDKIKEEILDEIKNINWFPKWGEIRITNMIKDRHEWCISRQRVWGVPIPVFYAEDDTEILDQEVLMHVANLFDEFGADVWFTREAKDLLPPGYVNAHSPNGVFRKETDIMDVWFDSGSSHKLLERRGLKYPADLYLEGSDQYRGWFNSSIITGVATTAKAPYKNCLTHGFTLDAEGRKMSKSLRNGVDPQKMCTEMGADILRLWVSSVEYNNDVRVSPDALKQVSESYRKIRNTFKFILANISDFHPSKEISFEHLNEVDKYMMIKLNNLLNDVKKAYDNFEFMVVYRTVNQFITNTLSSFYLDFTKDILYIEAMDSKNRLSVQTVLYKICDYMLRLLTPILPHTCSEAYDFLPGTNVEDVYLTEMPQTTNLSKYNDIESKYDEFMNFREQILKALEDARTNKIIGKSLNAKLIITPDKKTSELLNSLESSVKQMCIVSMLEIKSVAEELKIEVEEAIGHTCSRCWLIVDTIDELELCPRCASIVGTK